MFTYSKAVAREFDCDVLVIGGGPAGFGAAVAAARGGCQLPCHALLHRTG